MNVSYQKIMVKTPAQQDNLSEIESNITLIVNKLRCFGSLKFLPIKYFPEKSTYRKNLFTTRLRTQKILVFRHVICKVIYIGSTKSRRVKKRSVLLLCHVIQV